LYKDKPSEYVWYAGYWVKEGSRLAKKQKLFDSSTGLAREENFIPGPARNRYDEQDPYYLKQSKADWRWFDFYGTPGLSTRGVEQKPLWVRRGSTFDHRLHVFSEAHDATPTDEQQLVSVYHFSPTDTTEAIEQSQVLAIHRCHESILAWFATIIYCDCLYPHNRDPSKLNTEGWQTAQLLGLKKGLAKASLSSTPFLVTSYEIPYGHPEHYDSVDSIMRRSGRMGPYTTDDGRAQMMAVPEDIPIDGMTRRDYQYDPDTKKFQLLKTHATYDVHVDGRSRPSDLKAKPILETVQARQWKEYQTLGVDDDDDDEDAVCHYCQEAHTSSDCPCLDYQYLIHRE